MHKKGFLFINLPYSDPPKVKEKEISSVVLPVRLDFVCLQDSQQNSINTYFWEMKDLNGETLPSYAAGNRDFELK